MHIHDKYPIEAVDIGGQEFKNFGFMAIWERAWHWMDKWGIPIEAWQKQRISNVTDFGKEPSKESMAYYITERCESISDREIPEEFKPIIKEYKIHMMNVWGWPEWGYKDVKHLKPENYVRGK